MPVSNPSYFPPSRANGSIVGITAGTDFTGSRSFLAGSNAGNHATANDLLIIGDNAAVNALLTPVQDGVMALGTNALRAYEGSYNGNSQFGNMAIGAYAGEHLSFGQANVLIGDHAMGQVVSTGGNPSELNVIIGAKAAAAALTGQPNGRLNDNVIIGGNAAFPSTSAFNSSIVIGARACGQIGHSGSGGTCQESVVIGDGAGGSNASILSSIVIGANSGASGNTLQSIFIGNQIEVDGQLGVAIGLRCANLNGVDSVCIGANSGQANGSFNVMIGANSGQGYPANPGTSNVLVIEAGDQTSGHLNRTLIRGNFGGQFPAADGGNLIFGDSDIGVNDDMQGTNTVKLLNGTVGGVAPVGGGYFYISAGELHFVDSGNNDSKLSSGVTPANLPAGLIVESGLVLSTAPVAGDTLVVAPSVTTLALMATNAALGNHSAAQLATLTNAPAAGNPTKWIAINDNGTLRGIPTWLI